MWGTHVRSSVFAVNTPASEGGFRHKSAYTIVDVWKARLVLLGDQTNKRLSVSATDEPHGRVWYVLFPPPLEKPGYDVLGEYRNLGLMPLETTNFTFIFPGMTLYLSQLSRHSLSFMNELVKPFSWFKKLITVHILLS